MKILTLVFTYNTSLKDWKNNGSIDREVIIYTELLKYFDKIYFITYGKNDKIFQKKLPKNIIILPKKYSTNNFLYSLLIPFAYRKELQKSSWIKTNQIMGSWTAVLIKLFFGKKIVIRTGYTESLFFVNKNFLRQKIIWLIEFSAYKFANIATITSKHQLEYIIKKYNPKNIYVIPNGINTDLFKPIDNKKNITNTLKLLFVGRLHKEKNIINLVKSLKNIKNIQLTIIGNGILYKKILTLKNKYGLSLTIINKVANTSLPKIYNQADIYIQPSLYEGNPKTILEAMSCGLPVISTNIAGVNNIITHKKNGYLCQIEVNSIKTAILKLKNNIPLRKKLGENARKYILKNYNLHDILKKEISLYKSYKKND